MPDMLGHADEIRVTVEETLISGGKGSDDEIKERLKSIKSEYERTISEYDKEKLTERYNAIYKGVVVLRVGGLSDSEIIKATEEYNEVIKQVKAAIKTGLLENIKGYMDSALVQLDKKKQSASNDEKAGIETIQGIIHNMKIQA